MWPEMKTHGHGYHADLELSDRSKGGDSRFGYPFGNCIGCC